MSRYKFQDQHVKEKPKAKIHPVWRGVGFLMMIVIPIISYAATELLIAENQLHGYFPWPGDILAKPGELLYNGDPLLYFKILITVSFILVFYALFTLITFIFNSMFGAPRYGPLDAPPINVKVRKKAR
jgi:hypothetical protein